MRAAISLIILAATIPTAVAQSDQNSCSQYNQEFNVYFQSQSSEIQKIGHAIIDQALENVSSVPSSCKVGEIKIDSHTDTAGSSQRNMYLSQAIAQNFIDLFTELGFSKSVLNVTAHGENMPAKSTRNDVREPLNRRTTIKVSLSPA